MSRPGIKLLAALLVLTVAAAPAMAGKKKTVKKSFSATNIPLPLSGSVQPGGCANGQEGVHKTTVSFKTPGTGLLTTEIHGFMGDWDLHVAVKGAIIAASTSDNASSDTETVSGLPLKKGTPVDIIVCNWSGGPTADGSYTYTYKK